MAQLESLLNKCSHLQQLEMDAHKSSKEEFDELALKDWCESNVFYLETAS